VIEQDATTELALPAGESAREQIGVDRRAALTPWLGVLYLVTDIFGQCV
jgi:hypothetical protein